MNFFVYFKSVLLMDDLPRVNNVIPDLLWAGANPVFKNYDVSKQQVDSLESLGIEYIICLPESKELIPTLWELFSGRFITIHEPIKDRNVTDDWKVIDLVNKILELIKDGKKVFVFCMGGKGRTGTICSIVYAKYYKCDTNKALKEIDRLYRTRKELGKVICRSPQTRVQFAQVRRLLGHNL